MDYKILKILGSGFLGKVFLIENKKDSKKYVLKRQKILKKNIKINYKYEIWREIDFSKFVNTLPKNKIKYFMKMYEYKILDNCNNFSYNYLSKKSSKIANNFFKDSKYCMDIIYEDKHKDFYTLLKKNNISLKEKYSFLIQIFYALDIMKKNGYSHNDLHPHNIMYNISKDDIKIKGKKIKSKYVYSLIDYGFVNHKKYNLKRKNVNEFVFLQILNRVNILIEIYKENKWKLSKNNTDPNMMFSQLLEMYEYKKTWNKIKNKLLNIFPHFSEFYIFFENNPNLNQITNYLWNNDNNANIYIETLFLAYNTKKYYEIFDLNKIKKKNFIPGNDIEFIILNFNDYNKLIKYFINKI